MVKRANRYTRFDDSNSKILYKVYFKEDGIELVAREVTYRNNYSLFMVSESSESSKSSYSYNAFFENFSEGLFEKITALYKNGFRVGRTFNWSDYYVNESSDPTIADYIDTLMKQVFLSSHKISKKEIQEISRKALVSKISDTKSLLNLLKTEEEIIIDKCLPDEITARVGFNKLDNYRKLFFISNFQKVLNERLDQKFSEFDYLDFYKEIEESIGSNPNSYNYKSKWDVLPVDNKRYIEFLNNLTLQEVYKIIESSDEVSSRNIEVCISLSKKVLENNGEAYATDSVGNAVSEILKKFPISNPQDRQNISLCAVVLVINSIYSESAELLEKMIKKDCFKNTEELLEFMGMLFNMRGVVSNISKGRNFNINKSNLYSANSKAHALNKISKDLLKIDDVESCVIFIREAFEDNWTVSQLEKVSRKLSESPEFLGIMPTEWLKTILV